MKINKTQANLFKSQEEYERLQKFIKNNEELIKEYKSQVETKDNKTDSSVEQKIKVLTEKNKKFSIRCAIILKQLNGIVTSVNNIINNK
jgi:ketosteroid isomerase-like protein